MIELVRPIIGCQMVLVQGLGSPAADYHASAPVQEDPDIAGHKALGSLDLGIQVLSVVGKPESVVHHIGVFLDNFGLASGLLLG